MNNNDKMSVEHSQIINGNVPVTSHIGCPLHWRNRTLDEPYKDVHGTRYGIFL